MPTIIILFLKPSKNFYKIIFDSFISKTTKSLHDAKKQKNNYLDDSAFLRTQSYITEICYFEFWLAPHWDFFQKIHLNYLPQYTYKVDQNQSQVQVGLNIAQNHSSNPYKIISSHYLPQFTWKVDQKWNLVKFKSVRTLLRIIHLAHRKSYLVIICPNSHEKLTKSEIRSSSSRFEYCLESLI